MNALIPRQDDFRAMRTFLACVDRDLVGSLRTSGLPPRLIAAEPSHAVYVRLLIRITFYPAFVLFFSGPLMQFWRMILMEQYATPEQVVSIKELRISRTFLKEKNRMVRISSEEEWDDLTRRERACSTAQDGGTRLPQRCWKEKIKGKFREGIFYKRKNRKTFNGKVYRSFFVKK